MKAQRAVTYLLFEYAISCGARAEELRGAIRTVCDCNPVAKRWMYRWQPGLVRQLW